MTSIIGILFVLVFIYAMFHNPGGGSSGHGGHDDKKDGKGKGGR